MNPRENGKILTTAARILVVEAYHAGNTRLHVAKEGIAESDQTIDDIDQPVRSNNFFPTTQEALSLIRTPAQVAALVGPFFPNGLNSKVP